MIKMEKQTDHQIRQLAIKDYQEGWTKDGMSRKEMISHCFAIVGWTERQTNIPNQVNLNVFYLILKET